MVEVTKIRNDEVGFGEPESSAFISHFRDMRVYQEAFQLSVAIHKCTQSFPRDEQYSTTNQIRRCTKGVCANIAEGYGRQQFSKPEFGRFIMMAIGSANEAQVWLDYCRELNYITQEEWEKWNDGYDKVQRMLYKLRGFLTS